MSDCKECERLRAERSQYDCRFAGRYWEASGSHCPLGSPCARCREDSLLSRVKNQSDAAMSLVEAHDAVSEENARLRAENAKLREAVTWRPLFNEEKDEWLVPADVDVLLYMPSTHPQLPAEMKAGFARSTKGGWFAGWATHWLPLPEAPR